MTPCNLEGECQSFGVTCFLRLPSKMDSDDLFIRNLF